MIQLKERRELANQLPSIVGINQPPSITQFSLMILTAQPCRCLCNLNRQAGNEPCGLFLVHGALNIPIYFIYYFIGFLALTMMLSGGGGVTLKWQGADFCLAVRYPVCACERICSCAQDFRLQQYCCLISSYKSIWTLWTHSSELIKCDLLTIFEERK